MADSNRIRRCRRTDAGRLLDRNGEVRTNLLSYNSNLLPGWSPENAAIAARSARRLLIVSPSATGAEAAQTPVAATANRIPLADHSAGVRWLRSSERRNRPSTASTSTSTPGVLPEWNAGVPFCSLHHASQSTSEEIGRLPARATVGFRNASGAWRPWSGVFESHLRGEWRSAS